jgi:hypothetical protein
MRTLVPLCVLLSAAALLPACGSKIGDSCSANVDCSSLGDRTCDTAQTEGYCTVEGCNLTSCPDEAACVAFFPTAFLSVACDPLTEDAVELSSDAGTAPRTDAGTPVGATNDCRPDEFCTSSGFCVQSTLERRFCMKKCGDDGDCRDGYECRQTGTRGAEAIPDASRPGYQLRFCAQKL